MKIARVKGHLLRVPVPVQAPGIDQVKPRAVALVEITTDTGITGYGITSLVPSKAIVALTDQVAAPLITGMDCRSIAAVWNTMYRELGHRGQTGLASHVISAIDIALWDIRGKALGEPVWRLLGGARSKVPCYVTCGLPSFDNDQLVAVAKHWVAQGFGGLKLVVGVIALNRAHEFINATDALREDARRIAAVREAVGEKIDIAIDINCELDTQQALTLARLCEPYDIAFIEEPVMDNDPARMADFRRQSRAQVATGQSMGALARFAELLRHQAVDILQPNVINCGGYTGGQRVANLALAFEVPIGNGGGSTVHNLHLQAGTINGTVCEWHPYQSAGATAVICPGAPKPERGWLYCSEAPGLGFDPDPAALKEYAITT